MQSNSIILRELSEKLNVGDQYSLLGFFRHYPTLELSEVNKTKIVNNTEPFKTITNEDEEYSCNSWWQHDLCEKLAPESRTALLEHVMIASDSNANRMEILSDIFHEGALAKKMHGCGSDIERGKRILDKYFQKGYQLRPESMKELYGFGLADKLLKNFIQHEACTTIHLIHICKEKNFDYFISYCLEKNEFTVTSREEYSSHAGKSLSDSLVDYFKKYNGFPVSESGESDKVIAFLKLLNKHSKLFTSEELGILSETIVKVYNKNAKDLEKVVVSIVRTKKKINETLEFLRKSLAVIVNHPSYPFSVDSSRPDHLLFLAAANGWDDVINPFLTHPDTPQEAISKAVALLKDKEQAIKNISDKLFKERCVLNCFLFYTNMKEKVERDQSSMNLDVALYICKMVVALFSLRTDAMDAMTQDQAFLQRYKKKKISLPMLLFQASEEDKREKIVSDTKNEIMDSLFKLPDSLPYGNFYKAIFDNGTLTAGCKIVALYTLLDENSGQELSIKDSAVV